MTPATRKRLLELWKRVPETRPDVLNWDDGGFISGPPNEHDWEYVPDDLAELAACGKLCEWLVSKHEIGAVVNACIKSASHETALLDEMLAAAEAVAGELATKGDAMSTEHIWSTDASAAGGEAKPKSGPVAGR